MLPETGFGSAPRAWKGRCFPLPPFLIKENTMKNKKPIFVLIFAAAVLLFASCTSKETRQVTVSFRANPELLGTIKGSPTQTVKAGEPTDWVMAVPRDGFSFISWSDGSTEERREGETFTEDTELTAYFELTPYELPVLEITMPNGDEVISKTEYNDITLSITNTDEEYCIENVPGFLRGRGNATWKLMEKKSYKLKFEKKQNLLGIGEYADKDWILLANHCDQTMLRNYLAFYLARELDGIEYTTDARFVEVVINGKYKGVYLLCEQVEAAKGRVNIEVDPKELDTGYLIELDQYADDDEGAVEDVTYFSLKSGDLYTLKSDATPEQVAFIKEYITQVDKAIRNCKKEEIEKLIDLDSCVDMYILQEFMLNIDVGWSSFFMYKNAGGKLFFGPAWDFDLAAGNDRRLFAGGSEGVYVGDPDNSFKQRNKWYMILMQEDWFKALVKERWNEVRPYFEEISSVAEQTAKDMKQSVDRNYARWDIFRQRINQEPDCVMILANYRLHTKHLYKWLDDRYAWFDGWVADDFYIEEPEEEK